jgi:hypothetical protein
MIRYGPTPVHSCHTLKLIVGYDYNCFTNAPVFCSFFLSIQVSSWTLSVTWESHPDDAHGSVLSAPAGATYLLGIMVAMFGVLCTHALSGPLLHLDARGLSSLYRIWQPFKGGLAFVLLQGIGWCMFGAGVVTGLTTLRYVEV